MQHLLSYQSHQLAKNPLGLEVVVRSILRLLLTLILGALIIGACTQPEPTSTPTLTPSGVPPTLAPSPTATSTPTLTPTVATVPTPAATAAPTPVPPATPTATSTPTPTSTVATVSTPVPTATPTAVVAVPKGPLVFQAKLDGTDNDARMPRNIGRGAPSASDVRFVPGAIELIILEGPAETGINLKQPARLRYVLSLDLVIQPGSEVTFFVNLRWDNTKRMGYGLVINSATESLRFRYVNNSAQPQVAEVLSPTIQIPGLGTGRTFNLTAVVEEARYRVFLDGSQTADVTDSRVPLPMTPFLGISGSSGLVRVVGVHIYAPASTATSAAVPRGGSIWSPGIPGGIPDVPVAANVKDFGAKGDGVADDYDAFESAMRSVTRGAVLIPAGTYLLKSPLDIRKSIVLRGEGAEKTRLVFDLGGRKAPAISVQGKETGPWVNLAGGYSKGSTTLSLRDTTSTSFTPGSFAEIRQENDPAVMYTDPMWKQPWAEFSVGQVVKVVSQSGNGVRVEEPLRMGYSPSMSPQVRGLEVVPYSGIERLYLKRLDRGVDHMTYFFAVAYCWVREVESEYAYRSHIQINTGYACEIRDNYIHHAHDYGGGGCGCGYGAELNRHTTNVLVENNIFVHLRHSMIIQVGAVGNVFGYNYSREPVSQGGPLPDISVHGHYPSFNLFEGNVVQEIGISDFWGPVGPGNVYFRNLVEDKDIFVRDHSSEQIIMGNRIVRGYIRPDDTITNLLVHGNSLKGQVFWDPAIPERTFPASYYRSSKPRFFGPLAWPSIGPAIATGTNPAFERYKAGSYIP